MDSFASPALLDHTLAHWPDPLPEALAGASFLRQLESPLSLVPAKSSIEDDWCLANVLSDPQTATIDPGCVLSYNDQARIKLTWVCLIGRSDSRKTPCCRLVASRRPCLVTGAAGQFHRGGEV